MSNVIEQFKRNRKYQIGGPLYSPSELPTQAQEQLARANGVNPKPRLSLLNRMQKWIINQKALVIS